MRLSTFWSAFFRGMAAPVTMYERRDYRYPHKSEADAIAGDWERVGGYMQRAIDRASSKMPRGEDESAK